MIDKSQFRRTEGGGQWFIDQTVCGFEITVPDYGGSPKDVDIAAAGYIIDNLDAISAKAVSFIKYHLTMSGEYMLGGVEVLSEPDRHGAQALLVYHNEEDGYLWIEAGLRGDSPVYALVKYY
jgi:hypothetical protein